MKLRLALLSALFMAHYCSGGLFTRKPAKPAKAPEQEPVKRTSRREDRKIKPSYDKSAGDGSEVRKGRLHRSDDRRPSGRRYTDERDREKAGRVAKQAEKPHSRVVKVAEKPRSRPSSRPGSRESSRRAGSKAPVPKTDPRLAPSALPKAAPAGPPKSSGVPKAALARTAKPTGAPKIRHRESGDKLNSAAASSAIPDSAQRHRASGTRESSHRGSGTREGVRKVRESTEQVKASGEGNGGHRRTSGGAVRVKTGEQGTEHRRPTTEGVAKVRTTPEGQNKVRTTPEGSGGHRRTSTRDSGAVRSGIGTEKGTEHRKSSSRGVVRTGTGDSAAKSTPGGSSAIKTTKEGTGSAKPTAPASAGNVEPSRHRSSHRHSHAASQSRSQSQSHGHSHSHGHAQSRSQSRGHSQSRSRSQSQSQSEEQSPATKKKKKHRKKKEPFDFYVYSDGLSKSSLLSDGEYDFLRKERKRFGPDEFIPSKAFIMMQQEEEEARRNPPVERHMDIAKSNYVFSVPTVTIKKPLNVNVLRMFDDENKEFDYNDEGWKSLDENGNVKPEFQMVGDEVWGFHWNEVVRTAHADRPGYGLVYALHKEVGADAQHDLHRRDALFFKPDFFFGYFDNDESIFDEALKHRVLKRGPDNLPRGRMRIPEGGVTDPTYNEPTDPLSKSLDALLIVQALTRGMAAKKATRKVAGEDMLPIPIHLIDDAIMLNIVRLTEGFLEVTWPPDRNPLRVKMYRAWRNELIVRLAKMTKNRFSALLLTGEGRGHEYYQVAIRRNNEMLELIQRFTKYNQQIVEESPVLKNFIALIPIKVVEYAPHIYSRIVYQCFITDPIGADGWLFRPS